MATARAARGERGVRGAHGRSPWALCTGLPLLAWALAAALWGTAGMAQVWATARYDDGHFVYHTARAGAGLTFACYAPSRQGKTAFEVGAHETQATKRGMIRLEFDTTLIAVHGVSVARSDLVLWIDGTGYLLPEAQQSDFYGYWGVALKWDDGLFKALNGAETVILAPGQEKAWQFPVTRIGQALGALRRGCESDWAAAQPAPAKGAVQTVITVPPQVADRVTIGCSGPAPLTPEALQAGDLDRDGAPDFVLDWGRITCPGPSPRPMCGAANCTHDVFLSSRGYGRPVEYLGTVLAIITLPDGTLGLARRGSFSLCGANGEFCAAPVAWDGTKFTERP